MGFRSSKCPISSTMRTAVLMVELCFWQLHPPGVWLPLPTWKCCQRVGTEGRKVLHVPPSPTALLAAGLAYLHVSWIQSRAEVCKLLPLFAVIQGMLGTSQLQQVLIEGWRRLSWGLCLLADLWVSEDVPHRDSFILKAQVRQRWT